jgi:hypothetical protein
MGAAPYLGRTSTGWIAPACLAHSFDHLVGAREQRRRQLEAKRPCGLEVDHELDLGRLLDCELGDDQPSPFDGQRHRLKRCVSQTAVCHDIHEEPKAAGLVRARAAMARTPRR